MFGICWSIVHFLFIFIVFVCCYNVCVCSLKFSSISFILFLMCVHTVCVFIHQLRSLFSSFISFHSLSLSLFYLLSSVFFRLSIPFRLVSWCCFFCLLFRLSCFCFSIYYFNCTEQKYLYIFVAYSVISLHLSLSLSHRVLSSPLNGSHCIFALVVWRWWFFSLVFLFLSLLLQHSHSTSSLSTSL